MRSRRRLGPVAVTLVAGATGLVAWAQEPTGPPVPAPTEVRGSVRVPELKPEVARRTATGNSALLKGDVEEARQAYAEAQVLAPQLPQLEYDVGLAALLAGDLDAAEGSFTRTSGVRPSSESGESDAQAGDLALDSRYNLSHVALGRRDVDSAVKHLARVVAEEQAAEDARRNLELLLRLKQQQEREQQEQDQQQQDQQQQDEQESEDQQQGEGEQEPDPSGEPDDEQEPQEPSDESDDQQDSGGGQGQGEEDEEDDEKGQQEQAPEQEQPQEQEPPQDRPADDSQGDGDQPQDGPAQPPPPAERPGQMTRDKAMQLLDALADEEREALRERMRALRGKTQPPPAGKDW